MEELSYLFHTFIAIFVIVDPFAVIPVYLSLTERFPTDVRKRICFKSSVTAFGILSLFAVLGLTIFNVFGITIPAFQIGGGILLLNLGIAQLNANRTRVKAQEQNESMEREDISIFPLATPLLAGPGAISTVVLVASKASTTLRNAEVVLAILGVMILCYVVLRLATGLYRVLGHTGLNLLTRIMGLILTAIAVQYILNGLHGALVAMKVLKVG